MPLLDAPAFGDLRDRAVAQPRHLVQALRFPERVIVRLEEHLSQRPQELGIDLQGGLLDGMPLAVRIGGPHRVGDRASRRRAPAAVAPEAGRTTGPRGGPRWGGPPGRGPRRNASALGRPDTTTRLPFRASRTQEQGWGVAGEKGHPAIAVDRGEGDRLPLDCGWMDSPSRRPCSSVSATARPVARANSSSGSSPERRVQEGGAEGRRELGAGRRRRWHAINRTWDRSPARRIPAGSSLTPLREAPRRHAASAHTATCCDQVPSLHVGLQIGECPRRSPRPISQRAGIRFAVARP